MTVFIFWFTSDFFCWLERQDFPITEYSGEAAIFRATDHGRFVTRAFPKVFKKTIDPGSGLMREVLFSVYLTRVDLMNNIH